MKQLQAAYTSLSSKGCGIYFLIYIYFVPAVHQLLVSHPFMCLQLEVMLEDNLTLPSNGKLYSKVLNWVQRSIWENGDQLERLMEEVSFRAHSAASSLLCPSPLFHYSGLLTL